MKKAKLARAVVVGLATGWMLMAGQFARAEQTPPGKPTLYYDQYEPSQRQRLRRETCGRDEVALGPYCTKKCESGYIFVAGAKPPRCRSVEPLAPGKMPSGVRKQTGKQAPPKGGVEPPKKGTGQG